MKRVLFVLFVLGLVLYAGVAMAYDIGDGVGIPQAYPAIETSTPYSYPQPITLTPT